MSPHEWGPDALVSGGTAMASEALAVGLGRPDACVVALHGDPAELEVLHPGRMGPVVSRALARAGRELAAGLRARTGPSLVRGAALAEHAPELIAALRAHGHDDLLCVPLVAEAEVAGCALAPADEAEAAAVAERGAPLAALAFRCLHLAASAAALRTLVAQVDRSGVARVDGAAVVDPDGRLLLAHGLLRRAPGWTEGFARPLDALPGGAVLRRLPIASSDALRWEEHLFPPLAARGTPVALSAVALGPADGLASGSRMILAHDLRDLRLPAGPAELAQLLAHRMRAPLAAVADALGRIDRGDPNAAWAAAVAEHADRIRRTLQATSAAVDMNRLIEDALEAERHPLAERRVRVFSFLRPSLPSVAADRPHLLALPGTLLRTASASLGDGEGTLTVRSWAEGGWVCLAASDTGRGPTRAASWTPDPIGPDTEEAPADGPIERLRYMVESAGGRLDVESRPGVWNRYTVMVPAAGATDAADAPARAPEAQPDRAETPAGGLAVLVVDDNAALRSVMRRFLERRGHSVTEATDGTEALRIVESRTFDRVLVDVNMPGMGGAEFFLGLASVEPDLQQRTIFMTGGPTDPEVTSLIRSSGRRPLFKPFQLNEAAGAIEA